MPKLKHLLVSFIAAAGLFVIFSGTTYAATIDVAAGTDAIDDNSVCQLSEAIQNINDGSQTHDDCVEVGAYGTDDTINLPAGTITLTADLSAITESVTISGQGMGTSTIDGDGGAYNGIELVGTGTEQFNVSGFTIQQTNYRGIEASDGNFVAERIEVYGGSDIGPAVGLGTGVRANNTLGESLTVSMRDIYVHHINTSSGDSLNGVSVDASGTGGGHTVVNMENITVANLSSSTAGALNGIVLVLFDGVAHTIDARVSNATVTEITNTSDGGLASGLSAAAVSATGDVQLDLEVNNATVSGVRGSVGVFGASGGIGLAGGAASDSYSTNATLTARNVVVLGSFADDTASNCSTGDLTPVFMGTGTPNISFTSSGGNLSDDDSCSSYLTQSSDQNNVTGLASTLGTLGDYGGYVPTIPLLEGSPAIDAGVTVAGLTSDARGVSRPLGLAYDSGAYESPFTKRTNTETLADTGQNIKLTGSFAALLLVLGFALQLRRHYV